VRALRDAGVNVAAGADNLQDPFNPVGRGDPLETAGLMIMAAHALPEEALEMVSGAARRAMGLGPCRDHVAIRASTIREAIAFGPADRVVIRCGSTLETQRSRDRD
jgi:cytosine deaminase